MQFAPKITPKAAVALNDRATSRRLHLVKSANTSVRVCARELSATPLFSASEMRHSFAIQPLQKPGAFKPRPYLYYCVRCKWLFRVNDSRDSIVPLDQTGAAVTGDEAARRVASFHAGPCPVFKDLTVDGHVAQAFTNSAVIGLRLLAALALIRRRWKQRLQPRREATLSGKQRQIG
jgi:hypothetical protein